jgi:hypothetical protein
MNEVRNKEFQMTMAASMLNTDMTYHYASLPVNASKFGQEAAAMREAIISGNMPPEWADLSEDQLRDRYTIFTEQAVYQSSDQARDALMNKYRGEMAQITRQKPSVTGMSVEGSQQSREQFPGGPEAPEPRWITEDISMGLSAPDWFEAEQKTKAAFVALSSNRIINAERFDKLLGVGKSKAKMKELLVRSRDIANNSKAFVDEHLKTVGINSSPEIGPEGPTGKILYDYSMLRENMTSIMKDLPSKLEGKREALSFAKQLGSLGQARGEIPAGAMSQVIDGIIDDTFRDTVVGDWFRLAGSLTADELRASKYKVILPVGQQIQDGQEKEIPLPPEVAAAVSSTIVGMYNVIGQLRTELENDMFGGKTIKPAERDVYDKFLTGITLELRDYHIKAADSGAKQIAMMTAIGLMDETLLDKVDDPQNALFETSELVESFVKEYASSFGLYKLEAQGKGSATEMLKKMMKHEDSLNPKSPAFEVRGKQMEWEEEAFNMEEELLRSIGGY